MAARQRAPGEGSAKRPRLSPLSAGSVGAGGAAPCVPAPLEAGGAGEAAGAGTGFATGRLPLRGLAATAPLPFCRAAPSAPAAPGSGFAAGEGLDGVATPRGLAEAFTSAHWTVRVYRVLGEGEEEEGGGEV